jgi:hypothetical protein
LRGLLTQWAALNGAEVLFITVGPMLGLGGNPPIALVILCSTVVFGLIAIIRLYDESR